MEGAKPSSGSAERETLRRFFLGLSAVGTTAVGTTAAIGFLCVSGFKEKAAGSAELFETVGILCLWLVSTFRLGL